MAYIAGSYDENAEASADFTPIPTGTYRAKIVDSYVVEISKRDNKGRCLRLTWQIETGPHDGRLVWQRLNMWAENMGPNTDKVVSIANSHFASIREATGKRAPQDSSELHHIACDIHVGLSKPRDGYDQQNEVKSVKPAGGGQPAAAPPQRAAPPPGRAAAPAGANGSAPWRKSA